MKLLTAYRRDGLATIAFIAVAISILARAVADATRSIVREADDWGPTAARGGSISGSPETPAAAASVNNGGTE